MVFGGVGGTGVDPRDLLLLLLLTQELVRFPPPPAKVVRVARGSCAGVGAQLARVGTVHLTPEVHLQTGICNPRHDGPFTIYYMTSLWTLSVCL